MKKKRKRKLQGTYSDLSKAAPAYEKGLQNIGATHAEIETTPNKDTTPAGMYLLKCQLNLTYSQKGFTLHSVFSNEPNMEKILQHI